MVSNETRSCTSNGWEQGCLSFGTGGDLGFCVVNLNVPICVRVHTIHCKSVCQMLLYHSFGRPRFATQTQLLDLYRASYSRRFVSFNILYPLGRLAQLWWTSMHQAGSGKQYSWAGGSLVPSVHSKVFFFSGSYWWHDGISSISSGDLPIWPANACKQHVLISFEWSWDSLFLLVLPARLCMSEFQLSEAWPWIPSGDAHHMFVRLVLMMSSVLPAGPQALFWLGMPGMPSGAAALMAASIFPILVQLIQYQGPWG